MKSIFNNIDRTLLRENLYGFTLITVLCAILGAVDAGPFFIPIVIGLFIALINIDRQRIKYIGFLFLPVLFFVVFVTGGGLFIFASSADKFAYSNVILAIIGVWCSQLIILITWSFYKIKIYALHFILTGILILPPYLLGLDPSTEFNNSTFLFYLLWNIGLSTGLCLIFSQKTIILVKP